VQKTVNLTNIHLLPLHMVGLYGKKDIKEIQLLKVILINEVTHND